MIPFPDGSYEKHGLDAVKVYRPDETSVIKFRRIDADTRWYLDAFNELFGDRTRYEILEIRGPSHSGYGVSFEAKMTASGIAKYRAYLEACGKE